MKIYKLNMNQKNIRNIKNKCKNKCVYKENKLIKNLKNKIKC